MAENYVKIGAKDVKFAKLDDNGFIVGDPISLPGTTQVKISITSDNATISADDGPYMTLSSGIEKITLTISNYFLTPEVKSLILGTTYVNGMEIYGDDTMPNHVAVMYETQLMSNTKHPLYMGLLNGTFKFPESTTKTLGSGAPDPSAENLEGEFVLQERGNMKTAAINGFTSDKDFNKEDFDTLVFPKDQSSLATVLAKLQAAIEQAKNTAPAGGSTGSTPTTGSETNSGQTAQ